MGNKGIDMSVRRHIKEMRAKGEEPTVEKVTHKITHSFGFRVVNTVGGYTASDVEEAVRKILWKEK